MASSHTEQNRYAFPKFKVFIFGQDVTKDVISVNVNSHDGEAPNTCQITMLNEFDKYIMTSAEIAALNGVVANRLNIPWVDTLETGTLNPTGIPDTVGLQGTQAFNRAVASSINQPDKRNILLAKSKAVQNLPIADRQEVNGVLLSSQGTNNYFGSQIVKYPLADGLPIFHVMDPVRVFMRDPFNPRRWYHHFTGFVSDMVDNTDENNQKTLTLTIEDPTKLFRFTRVFVNPGVIDSTTVIAENDLKVQAFTQHFLEGFTLPEIFFTLIFGPDRVGAQRFLSNVEGQGGSTAQSARLRGIGHFAFDTSDVFLFGPDPPTIQPSNNPNTANPDNKVVPPQTNLLDIKPGIKIDKPETWQSILDHEVALSDLWMMATEDDRNQNQTAVQDRISSIPLLSDGTADIEKVCDLIGSRPDLYMPDGGRLLVLVPNSLGLMNRDVVVKGITQSNFLNSEWSSAGTIMFEVVDRIQFVMYCTPKGDFVVEPPFFDADPSDFGTTKISSSDFLSRLPTSSTDGQSQTSVAQIYTAETLAGQHESNSTGRIRGPYGSSYVILRKDTYKSEMASIDDKVHTIAVCSHQTIQNWEQIPNTSFLGDNTVVRLPDLIPLYGTRVLPLTPRGYVGSSDAAYYYAQVQLNKLNADAHSVKIDHIPNLRLWLNRPIYFQGRNALATTKQISHSLTWGEKGDMSTTSDLYAMRLWNGEVDQNDKTKPIWTPLAGAGYGARGINYAILFGTAPIPDKSIGPSNNADLSTNLDSTSTTSLPSDAQNDVQAAQKTVGSA